MNDLIQIIEYELFNVDDLIYYFILFIPIGFYWII
jgi:hypothetical protein